MGLFQSAKHRWEDERARSDLPNSCHIILPKAKKDKYCAYHSKTPTCANES